MGTQFPPAAVPAADNVHGSPQPPSGSHPASSAPAVIKPATPHQPSDAPANNQPKTK
jgi:hypothetical protein